ncbi:MAG: penicillin acylase family protein [Desulfohalobiaceae bacterium]
MSLFLVLFLGFAALYAFHYLYSGLPSYEREFDLKGTHGRIGISNDERGVPRIEGTNLSDLFFAQGYVHARDRLWQMALQRLVVQGRLSSVFGKDLIETDKHVRRVGLSRIAQRILNATSSKSRDFLESYASGVNRYLSQHDLPLQFRLMGFEPEPWKPRDCAGILSLMAYNLGENWRNEALRQALKGHLEQDLYKDILPPYTNRDTPRVLDPLRRDRTRQIASLLNRTDLSAWQLPSSGSNSWVISPALSSTDSAVLANDAHLSLGLPCIWHECSLYSENELAIHGWGIPGAPGVVIGHNNRIAWGMTNIGDTQDLFLEKRHPDKPHRFEYNGEWKRAGVEKHKIQVQGQKEPRVIEVIKTRHGPLISRNPPLSLHWTAYEIEKSTIDAIMGMNQAGNWTEFKQALKDFTIPAQAVTYADVKGNIGFRAAGLIPVRKQGKGVEPMPGWKEGYDWKRFIAHEEMPESLNPKEGFLVTANHRITPSDYPYVIDLDTAPHYRMRRIADFLHEQEEITIKDSKKLQNDWYNQHAAERIPTWWSILHKHSQELTETEKEGLAVLEEWKQTPINHRSSPGAAIFQVWHRQLIKEVFQKRLPDELWQQLSRNAYMAYNSLGHLLDSQKTPWLPEGKAPPLLSSYKDTIKKLKTQQGENPLQWRWDRVQKLTLKHDLEKVPVLGEYLFNRGPYPYGGSPMTVNRAGYSLSDPYEVDHGPGLRFVAVMNASRVSAKGVIAGGQSGHPLSEHYEDQIKSWLEGEYYQLPFSGRKTN